MNGLRLGIIIGLVAIAGWLFCGLPPSTLAQQDPPKKSDGDSAESQQPEFINLLDADALSDKTWHCLFSDGAGNGTLDKQKTFSQIGKNGDAVLVVSGKPIGYLRTTRKYKNYVLRLKWRYTKDPNGNSGLLLHLQEPDKVWPQCFQVQTMTAEAGAIFPLGGAKSSNRQPPPDQKIVQPLKEWNEWEITSQDGKISLRIKKDDKWHDIGEITGCEPAAGYIGFQSEGVEVEFRDLQIKILSDLKEEKAAEDSQKQDAAPS